MGESQPAENRVTSSVGKLTIQTLSHWRASTRSCYLFFSAGLDIEWTQSCMHEIPTAEGKPSLCTVHIRSSEILSSRAVDAVSNWDSHRVFVAYSFLAVVGEQRTVARAHPRQSMKKARLCASTAQRAW